MSALLASLAALVFVLIGGAAWFGALLMTRKARVDLEHRVNLVRGAVATSIRNRVVASTLHHTLSSAGERIRRLFTLGVARRWGMRMNSLTLILIACGGAMAGWLLTHKALQFSNWIALSAAVAGFVWAPRLILQRQQRVTEQKFITLFPDAIDMVIRMLRAGLPVTAATRAVSREAPAPVDQVFRSIADQVDIGVPFEAALTDAAESIGLADFRFFAVAVALQRETGGNLAATLEILGDIIRKRRTVRLRARAATGEIRMSATILGSLPFFVTGAFMVISPGYLTPLVTDPRGHIIVGVILLGLTLAYVTMRRMLQSVTMA